MRLANSATPPVIHSSHVISDPIAEIKLPNLGKGKSWKEQKGKINGQEVTFMFNEARTTGVYFRFGGENNNDLNYVRDRAILEDKSLTVEIKETKAKLTDEEKAANKAERSAKTFRGRLTKYIAKSGHKENEIATSYSGGAVKTIEEMSGEQASEALEDLKKLAAEAKKQKKQDEAKAASDKKESEKPVKEPKVKKAQPDTGAA